MVLTRVTIDTKSIIDLIFTSIPEKHTDSGIIPVGISDHYLTYTIVNCKLPKSGFKFISRRNYNDFNLNRFLQDLAFSSVFARVFYIDDVHKAWDIWLAEYLRISNKHAPLRTHKVRDGRNPWVSHTACELMHERDYWHKHAISSKRKYDMDKYRYFRNKVNTTLQNDKKTCLLYTTP